ncbi:type II toxin-antitoxin system PrlF family antitoxin [Stappia sp.]|uniref:type II toxin-antitoxin system PrlF family antitoxin n=1 Tax=Stappia sp. TaxID=1870903 RepID=UPI003D13D658
MAEQLAFEATLTDKYQNTVPSAVRRALGLGKRDKVRYIIRDGEVLLQKVEGSADDDPVVAAFLDFVEKDMIRHPGRVTPLSAALVDEARALATGVDVDLDAPLDDD